MNQPFKGLKVVELAAVLAGPAVGTFFAELGATVLKIENKSTNGDVTRSWRLSNESIDNPVSAYYSAVNYGKESLQLDLKENKDINLVLNEIKNADILISNFKKGDDSKYGLDYETLKKVNPKLIYASINGFGVDSNKVAFDVVLQAETGMMSMNGNDENLPVKMPIAFIDLFAAHQLKEGVLVALIQRGITGKGAEVSVSLYDAALASLANQATNYLMNDHIPKPMGSLHPNIAPYGEMVTSKDGIKYVLAVGNNRQFQELCKQLKRPDLLTNEHYTNNQSRVQNRVKLHLELKETFKALEGETIYQQLIASNVPIGMIKNLQEVFEDKQAQRLILEEEIEGMKTKRVATAIFKITGA
jgi:crotonobetainyl-CoA:carnitine CoA-transferase CaiB-like acyl-CoA transferase